MGPKYLLNAHPSLVSFKGNALISYYVYAHTRHHCNEVFICAASAVDEFLTRLRSDENTPNALKAKLGIKLKVIMSSFICRLSSVQGSVASYCKMGR